MRKFITKFISLIIIFNLLLPRGFIAISQVSAQTVESPTSVPQQISQPTAPKPESTEKPTSAPQPTGSETHNNTADNLSPTTPPQPTNQPSTQPSPTDSNQTASKSTETLIPTGTQNNQSNSSSSSNQQSTESGSPPPSVNDPANIATGPLSDNYAAEINKKVAEIVNKNLAQMENKIAALSSTGFNYANLNTFDGQVVTGDSVSTLNLLNKLNSTMSGIGGFSVYNIYDNFKGDLTFQLADLGSGFTNAAPTVSKNSLTGPQSNNIADAQNSFTVKEANGNDAQLVNDLVLQANTGGNSASFNTGGGSIKTGNAVTLANIVNLANTNLNVSQWLFGVVNIFGTMAGNIILPTGSSGPPDNTSSSVLAGNNNTGFSSNNTASYTNYETTNVTNNNDAAITSNLDVTANTGNNTASINTGGGEMVTGQSEASISNTTVANSNTVKEDDTVWMVIVNEMGKWVGHIIGAPWESNVASNSLPMTVTAQNSGTGPLSNNQSSYENNDETSLTNNNTANIVNNIKASSDTGNNQSSYNTGAGQIETGNAKTGVNLVNMVNTNVVAKKFVAVLVNVLGTFLGDIIPSDQQTSSQTAGNNNVASTVEATANNSSSPLGPTSGITPTPLGVANYQPSSFSVASANIGGMLNFQDQYYAVPQSPVQPYKNSVMIQPIPVRYLGVSQADGYYGVPNRGLFLSPAFAKATETSIAGMLFGGSSIRVTPSWLSVLPLAIIIVLLRRRKKFNLTKYLNLFLELVL